MGEIIRKIHEEDFQEVSDLFEGQKYNGVDELKWLFTDPEDSQSYNAFVAIDDQGSIIGVIGYVKTVYVQNDKEISGVCPMSWKLKSGYKGMAGVLLFKEVSKLGEIALALAGTEISQKLYPMFNYKEVACFDNYYKILKPLEYFRILKKRSFVKKVGMFALLLPSYSFRISSRIKYTNLKFSPFENYVREEGETEILRKSMSNNYVNWILKCPFLKTEAFSVKKNGVILGVCILNMEKVENTLKGRIVHLPFLGYDMDIWVEVIKYSVLKLKEHGCCVVSGMAVHDICKKGFRAASFRTSKRCRESIYLKDDNGKMSDFNIKNWNMQFSEGDIALRNF